MSEHTHDKAMLAGVVVCGLSVATYSSWAQFSIAEAAGYPGNLAWVVPVSTDATAVLGTRAWMSPHYGNGVRSYGRFLALAAIVLSIITAALHLVVPGDTPIPWQLRLTVGGLPSLALAALVHLGALTAKDKPKQKPNKSHVVRRATASPRAATPTEQVPTEKSPSVVARTEDVTDLPTPAIPAPNKVGLGSNRQKMFAYLDEHPDATGADLDAVFNTTHYGRKVRRDWETRRTLHVVDQASGE